MSIRLFINSSLSAPVTAPVTVIAVAQSPYAVVAGDAVIEVITSGGNVTINLPAASGTKRRLWVKKITSDFNTVTIVAAGADLIDGAATAVLTGGALGALELQADGTSSWAVL